MRDQLKEFEELLYNHLIPEFCSDPNRRCEMSSFNRASVKISEYDASYFLRAWTGGLIRHVGRGLYRSARSAAGEQFFWNGPKFPEPRSFTLWLEPIITVGALARLHFDFGWPEHLIGTQSIDWAFDVVTFPPNAEHEFIAGEVKKSAVEVDQLIALMKHFGRDPNLQPPLSGKARNAYKKVSALRTRNAPVFWAVGPEGLSRVYRVLYREGEVIDFVAGSPDDLRYDATTWDSLHAAERMKFDDLRERVLRRPIAASDGNHSLRLWRAAENIQEHVRSEPSDDRLLHLMSRIGVLCRTLAKDLRSGHTSPEEVATLLDQLADLGEISFKRWMQ